MTVYYFAGEDYSSSDGQDVLQYLIDTVESLDELLQQNIEMWKCYEKQHSNYISANAILEDAQLLAHSDFEHCEDYLDDILSNPLLVEELDSLIHNFLERNNIRQPNCYEGVELLQTIPVTVELIESLGCTLPVFN